MKKMLLLCSLAVIGFTACQKDNLDPQEFKGITPEGATVKLKIDFGTAIAKSRAVEDNHLDVTYTPTVLSATLYAYSEYGVKTEIDITGEEFAKLQTSTEFSVGLPAGTKKIDIVLNNPSGKYIDLSENINYYNHKSDVNDKWMDDTNNYLGTDNYSRVFLTSEYYSKGGIELEGNTETVSGGQNDLLTLKLRNAIVVKPALARFEVLGGITVAEEAEFVDGNNLKWKKYPASPSDAINTEIEKTFGNLATSNQDILKSNDGQSYYVPEKYGVNQVSSTIYTSITNDNIIKWFPNAYYAVDVEEVYVNNIIVRDPTHSPYLAVWPGATDATKNWPNWYKSYHLDGWHKKGISSDNSFLCMGNMWDRIATAKDDQTGWNDVNFSGLNIPNVDGSTGNITMKVIKDKATPVANKSAYLSGGTRNIGIIDKKAAAYMIYAQSKGASTSDTDKKALMGELPHIIVKVKCYASKADYDAGTPVANKNFITISLFTGEKNVNKYITEFKRGTIYRLDLSKMLPLFVGDKPFEGAEMPKDPTNPGNPVTPSNPVDKDPEMPGSQLQMTVKVLDWETENMTPVI